MPKHIHLRHAEHALKEALKPTLEHAGAMSDQENESLKPALPEQGTPQSDPEAQPQTPATEAKKGSGKPGEERPDPESIREQILSEIQEQEALEEFRQTRPEMWLQVMRIGHLLELQEEFENEVWPEGSCFVHTATPGSQSFCVKTVLDVDLETCTVALGIFADEELDEGTVLLPLESICWFGFPKNAVQVGHKRLRGFTAGFINPAGN